MRDMRCATLRCDAIQPCQGHQKKETEKKEKNYQNNLSRLPQMCGNKKGQNFFLTPMTLSQPTHTLTPRSRGIIISRTLRVKGGGVTKKCAACLPDLYLTDSFLGKRLQLI